MNHCDYQFIELAILLMILNHSFADDYRTNFPVFHDHPSGFDSVPSCEIHHQSKRKSPDHTGGVPGSRQKAAVELCLHLPFAWYHRYNSAGGSPCTSPSWIFSSLTTMRRDAMTTCLGHGSFLHRESGHWAAYTSRGLHQLVKWMAWGVPRDSARSMMGNDGHGGSCSSNLCLAIENNICNNMQEWSMHPWGEPIFFQGGLWNLQKSFVISTDPSHSLQSFQFLIFLNFWC